MFKQISILSFCLIPSIITASDFFSESVTFSDLGKSIEEFYIKSMKGQTDPSKPNDFQFINDLWDLSATEELKQKLTLTDDCLKEIYSDSRSMVFHDDDPSLRLHYTINHAKSEVIRLQALSMAFGFEPEKPLARLFNERLNSDPAHEDLVNAHALAQYAAAGRPRDELKTGRWVELYQSSENPIYRMVALRNVLRSYPESFIETELDQSTLELELSRLPILDLIENDENLAIAEVAKKRKKELLEFVSKFESETGLKSASNSLGTIEFGRVVRKSERSAKDKTVSSPPNVSSVEKGIPWLVFVIVLLVIVSLVLFYKRV